MIQEMGIKVCKVEMDGKDFVRPTFLSRRADSDVIATDLKIIHEDGTVYILGNNDWAFLALDLIKPIKDEAKEILEFIHEEICNATSKRKKVVGVLLGLNDKRILDVFYGGRNACNRIYGYPVHVSKHSEDLVEVIVADESK